VDECKNTDVYQYVSIIDTLKAVLQNEEVRAQVLNPCETAEGHLRTFRDGTLYKQHAVFSQVEHCLEIVLYSDEFEVVNPLGPHKKKHKITSFYFCLGNLQSSCKSLKSSIFLLALCKSMHIQRYGYSRIAEQLNNELYVLETQGIDVDGYPHSLQGALAYIAGDNLNSHLIGGYNASFSPNVLYPCRFCLSSNDDIQKIVTVDCIELRTRDNYDQHSSIDLPQGGQRFGIRHRSEFISGSFHVADGLPPDIMHDLLEGVVPYETALVLKVFLSKKYLTLDELNEILSTWNYGPLDKADKPVPIASGFGETIKQNAGRMWCLVRLLPLMIGLKIPTGDVHWQFFLQLKDIVELAFAPRLAVGHTLLLQTKIQDHIQTFHELFPDRLIKPKQHFLLHYGHSILTYGPLRACWCMRFEAKHFYFSRMMRVVNNYKNSCRTLAERHQMNLAYLLECDNLFSEHEMSLSSAVIVDTNYLSESVVGLLISHKISVDQALHQLTFVHVNGVTYRSSMYVVLTVADDSPVFGRIDAIYVQDMRCVLLVQQCAAVYSSHLSAYEVHPTDDVAACAPKELLDYYPLSGYIVNLHRYIVLKNFLYDQRQFDI